MAGEPRRAGEGATGGITGEALLQEEFQKALPEEALPEYLLGDTLLQEELQKKALLKKALPKKELTALVSALALST